MSGIKQLFHQYNQELMEFMAPSPMMGMGYNPMMMGMKPPSSSNKPFNPWDSNSNKEKDKEKNKNFWKILLALGATGLAGAGGLYAYNQWSKNNSFKGQVGNAAGKFLGMNMDNMAGSAIDIVQQQMHKNAVDSQQKANAQNFAQSLVNRMEEWFKKNPSQPTANPNPNPNPNPINNTTP